MKLKRTQPIPTDDAAMLDNSNSNCLGSNLEMNLLYLLPKLGKITILSLFHKKQTPKKTNCFPLPLQFQSYHISSYDLVIESLWIYQLPKTYSYQSPACDL